MTDYIQTLEKVDYSHEENFLTEEYFDLMAKLQTEIDSSSEDSLLDYKSGQLSDEERETLLFNRYYLNKSVEQLDERDETHSYYTKLIKDTDNILVLFNLPLVKNRAKAIIKNRQLSPNIYPELLAPGIEGLHLAIRYFDPNKQCKLSTLAFPTISQKINEYIYMEKENIRLPYRQRERLIGLQQARGEFINNYHREPTHTELMKYYEKKAGRIGRKDYLLRAIESKCQVCLDAPITRKEPTPITKHELIGSTGRNPSKIVESKDTNNWILTFLKTETSERNRKVITSRWGLNGAPSKTRSTVSKEFNLSSERVRQIENEIKEKMVDKWLNDNPFFI